MAFETYSPHHLTGLRVAVAGAGVLGLSIAVLAARAGATVSVFDPRPLGDNASGVAAGMLAPALEALLDPQEARFERLREGLQAWPDFADALGLRRPAELAVGALYLDTPERLDVAAARLADLGAPAERLAADEARRRQPALSASAGEALLITGEGRIAAQPTLHEMALRLREAGGELIPAPWSPGLAKDFDETVLAAGYAARDWLALAPELSALQPIKGHVLHFAAGPTHGPTVRTASGYAAPQPGGVIFGATMEPGRADLTVDDALAEGLRAAAVRLMPALAGASMAVRTGVRAATSDGVPLVGRSQGGLLLAVGARRNGWLLAPLIAQEIMERLSAGRAGG